MNKWLDEKWESTLPPYNDKEYAMKQLDQLRNDLNSAMTSLSSDIMRACDGIDQVKCGLTRGHSWRLVSFDERNYPMRKPPGVYKYQCVYCGEVIMLQADKKKCWEPHIRIHEEES